MLIVTTKYNKGLVMLECVELTLLSRVGSAPGAEWRRGAIEPRHQHSYIGRRRT